MKRLFGGVLLAIGILVMTCSGLCSLAVIVMGIGSVGSAPAMLLFPAIVGGIPFALGFGAFRWGRSLLRQAADRGPDEDELRDRFK